MAFSTNVSPVRSESDTFTASSTARSSMLPTLNPRPGTTANMPVKAIRMSSMIRVVSEGGSINCTISSTLSPAVAAALPTAVYHDPKN